MTTVFVNELSAGTILTGKREEEQLSPPRTTARGRDSDDSHWQEEVKTTLVRGRRNDFHHCQEEL